MNRRLAGAVAVWLTALGLLASAAWGSTLTLVRGGWCWFADPRAIAWNNNVYFGWITGDTGNVEVARFNLLTGGWAQGRLHAGLPTDDHSNPTLTMDPEGHLIAFYSPHSGKVTRKLHEPTALWYRVATTVGGVREWGPERHLPTNTRGGLGYTYPSPVWAGYRMYLFWRGGDWQPTYSTTTMSFDHWTRAQTLLRGMPHERPYVKYDHYGDAIRFAYTAAHPTRKATDLYFGELRGWAVRRANGTPFRSRHHLPFVYTKGERIYSWRTAGRAWVWDIAHDSFGHPVIVYAAIRDKHRHSYRYARWTGKRWEDHLIANAGPHIDDAPGYSGGAALDHNDPNVVYVSVETGRSHFELYRWETRDDGRTWMAPPTRITRSSAGANMRPFVPLGTTGDRVLLWLWGKYEHWKDFSDLHVMLRANLTPQALAMFAGVRSPELAEASGPQLVRGL